MGSRIKERSVDVTYWLGPFAQASEPDVYLQNKLFWIKRSLIDD